jgi:hypothetical protein
MKKTTLVFSALAFASVATAQTANNGDKVGRLINPRTMMSSDDRPQGQNAMTVLSDGSEAVIWSEDFATGIPANWTNTDAVSTGAGLWQYRGVGGSLPADSGSLGAYASSLNVITSASAANGFVIFDSDFYDNAGIQGNFGGGVAPSPHQSLLITETINLSSETNVDLSFTQYYRRFAGPGGLQSVPASYVDVSVDGGTTWPHTLTYNADISVNSATTTNDMEARDISAWVAGQSNVKIRFRFDGDYYFWMLDDIQLISTPKFRLEFTALSNAPMFDFIMAPPGSAKAGLNTAAHRRDITWDCNALSTGQSGVYNAQLHIDLIQNGAVIQTISGPVNSAIWGGPGAANDTLTFNELNTTATPFQPSASGMYEFLYRVEADTNMAGTGTPIVMMSMDTLRFYETDSLISLDANNFTNSIGTTQLGDDGSAMAMRFDIVPSGWLRGVNIGLSTLTVPGGLMTVELFDSSAFTGATTGFDPAKLIASAQHTVTAADVSAGRAIVDLRGGQTSFVPLNAASSRGYYIVVTLFSNGGQNTIRIANDQSWDNTGGTAYMFVVGSQWFSGYSGSRSFENPWIRAIVSPTNIGLDEFASLDATIYPNPTNGIVNITLAKDFGLYNLRVLDLGGREVMNTQIEATAGTASQVDMSELSRGLYMIELSNGSTLGTFKVTVE